MNMFKDPIDDEQQLVSPDFVRCDNCLKRFEVFSIFQHIKKCSMISKGSRFSSTVMKHSPKRKYDLVSSSSESFYGLSSMNGYCMKRCDSTRHSATLRVLFGRPLLQEEEKKSPSSSPVSSSTNSSQKKQQKKQKTMKKKRVPNTIINKELPSPSLYNSISSRFSLPLTTPLSNSILEDLLFEDDPAQVLKSVMNSPCTSPNNRNLIDIIKEKKEDTITFSDTTPEDFSTSYLTQEALKALEEDEQIASPLIQEIEKQLDSTIPTTIDDNNMFLGSIIEFETWGQDLFL